MKKLMIAAALAAMVGGAYADTAYTFSASLKTTVGKSGKVTSTYNLGEDAQGAFWYEDQGVMTLVAAMPSYFTNKRVGGRTIPALSNLAKRDNAWLVANIVPLAATINPSAKDNHIRVFIAFLQSKTKGCLSPKPAFMAFFRARGKSIVDANAETLIRSTTTAIPAHTTHCPDDYG